MKRFLMVLIIIFVGIVYRHQSHILGISDSLTASEIISISNAIRQANNLLPLQPQDQLTRAAEAKAQAMLSANAWSHNTPTNTPWDFIDEQGYIYVIAGENLAKGFLNPEDVVKSWLDSPSHRANLLNAEYTATGVAVVVGNYLGNPETSLIVQYLAKPFDESMLENQVNAQFFADNAMTEMVKKIPPLLFMMSFLMFCMLSASIVIIIRMQKVVKVNYSPASSSHWRK